MLDNDINNWIHYYAYKLAVGSSITVIVFISSKEEDCDGTLYCTEA